MDAKNIKQSFSFWKPYIIKFCNVMWDIWFGRRLHMLHDSCESLNRHETKEKRVPTNHLKYITPGQPFM